MTKISTDMTVVEALTILRKELGCRHNEDSCAGIRCHSCEYNAGYHDVTQAIDIAISALEQGIRSQDDGK